MDASMDSFGAKDFETHVVVEDTSLSESSDALFDSATTHTILRDKNFCDENHLST